MLENLRRTYGDLLLSAGDGGLAATGALGNMEVGAAPWRHSARRRASVSGFCKSPTPLACVSAASDVSFAGVRPNWVSSPRFVLWKCEDWAQLPLELYSFPTVDALATRATEADLRAMGE